MLKAAKQKGLSSAMIDRLTLSDKLSNKPLQDLRKLPRFRTP